jgi:O-antigen/teichoic acid export membrane protein
MRDKEQFVKTIVVTIIWYIFNYGINFWLISYVTNRIGIEATGFVNLSKSFVSYANIITVAVNAYAVRFITLAFHEGDNEKVNKYFSSIFIADLIMGVVILVVALIMIAFIDKFVVVSTEMLTGVKLLFALTFFSYFITVVGTVYTTAMYIQNKLSTLYVVKCIGGMLEFTFLVYIFKLFSPAIWYVGLGSLVAAIICLLGNYRITLDYLPGVNVKLNYFSLNYVRELVISGSWNSINQLGNTLNSGLDLYITNLLLSNVAMGQVSIAKTLGAIPSTIYVTLSQPFQPELLRKYSVGDKEGMLNDFKLSMKLCSLFSIVFFAGFLTLGKAFYLLWIPTQDVDLIYKITVITLLTTIVDGCVYPLYYIYTLTLKNKFPCFMTVIGGAINVIGMLLLIKFSSLGVYAIVLTTVIVMTVINLISNPIYMCKCLKIPIGTFYPNILRSILGCAITSILLILIEKILPTASSWLIFALDIILVGFLGLMVCSIVIFSPKEIKKVVKNVLSKFNRSKLVC